MTESNNETMTWKKHEIEKKIGNNQCKYIQDI